MIRKTVWLIALAAAMPAMAGTVGFVDAERAVVTVAEGKAKLAELEAWAEPRRERLEQLQAEGRALQKELAEKRGVVAADAVRELENRIRDAARSFEDERRAFQRDLEKKQDEFLADIAVKVGTVASEYAEANGYDAVFVLNAQPLIYVADSADLTETVIRLYDQRFPVE